ncbi:MBL fold metallo-hydrolase [Desulfurivibrio alkaliphilus]|uniref:Beta-lactamase domain-containing protein n=1 Tax=Desulfurivibrio alkaliphilus (strain DSM 19089 / UNIQEM U267 / AHT2) TaxID=589865 RepID=D6Z1R8_DESAT|nr:MBL fold metallo-hydrolase [Desulfurivibrio alkaliphilus]ADH85493.1 beta-lactamase domain-containing protein [Desulfurivibrio alkaliphilus AHT 2]
MNPDLTFSHLSTIKVNAHHPTKLYQQAEHAVYWLGIDEETAFRCNVYLIVDGRQAVLVDPGSRSFFPTVRRQVAQLLPPEQISGIILCHQDPDVAASFLDWLELAPRARIYTSPRTQVLLPHYGRSGYEYSDITAQPRLELPSGAALRFIEAPFLHSPGAFVTYDETARCLFSGDIWAALDVDWQLVVDDFHAHRQRMDLFHLDYMASNIATQGFVRRLDGLTIDAILPQHGSIIPPRHVAAALAYLRNLHCGTDIYYPDLQSAAGY